MGKLAQQYTQMPLAVRGKKKTVNVFATKDGRASAGPFLGMTFEEACAFEAVVEAEYRRHPRETVDERAFYTLSDGKTLLQLFNMWAWAATKDYGKLKLLANAAQEEVLNAIWQAKIEDRPCFIINLKARQWGITTCLQIAEMLLATQLFHANILTMAHKKDKSQTIFSIQALAHKWMDYRPRADFSRLKAFFHHTETFMFVESAEDDEPARAGSYKIIHQSEPAFYSRPIEVEAAVASTLPNTGFRVWYKESTANGASNLFYDQWRASEKGENDFQPIFFPWWKHPEYAHPLLPLEDREFGPDKLDEEEAQLVSDLKLTPERLKWRRWCLQTLLGGDLDKFHQEYPSTPLEAFLTSGRPAFDRKALIVLYSGLENAEILFAGDIVESQV